MFKLSSIFKFATPILCLFTITTVLAYVCPSVESIHNTPDGKAMYSNDPPGWVGIYFVNNEKLKHIFFTGAVALLASPNSEGSQHQVGKIRCYYQWTSPTSGYSKASYLYSNTVTNKVSFPPNGHWWYQTTNPEQVQCAEPVDRRPPTYCRFKAN